MPETIGEQLRRARQERNLSLEQVAQNTYIRVHYLEALEADTLSDLPSQTQARGFLRMYASYLGINPEEILALLDDEISPPADSQPAISTSLPPQRESLTDQERPFFIEIGQKLQSQRELLGLSLDDIERHTHLRAHYLRALEAGDLEGLPSPVQGRGMLNNYATFLGLAAEPLLLRFADGLQARLAAKQAVRVTTTPSKQPTRRRRISPAPLRRLLSRDLLFGSILLIALVFLIGWGTIRVNALRSTGASTPTVPSIGDALQPTVSSSASPTSTYSAQQDDPLVPTAIGGGPPPTVEIGVTATTLPGTETEPGTATPTMVIGAIQVSIVVNDQAWVRVTVDKKIAFEGRMLPGSVYLFTGKVSIELITGNGAALQVSFNQQDLGTLGVYGEVVSRLFTLQGIVTATATVTSTSTATALITATPKLTGTPATATPQP